MADRAQPPGGDAPWEEELTLDELVRGRIRVYQPRAGYRVNVDSLLLAWFCGPPPYRRVVDLCAGTGVIGLALASRDPASRVTLAELQPQSAALARRNVEVNGLAGRVDVVEVDLSDVRASREALPGAAFDRVVASPPYFTLASGPPVPDEREAIARHEIRLTLGGLCKAARRVLAPSGKAAIVFPSERLAELLAGLMAERLTPIRMQLVHPKPGMAANRVLVEAQKGGKGGLVVAPPLFVRDESGRYGREAREALGEES